MNCPGLLLLVKALPCQLLKALLGLLELLPACCAAFYNISPLQSSLKPRPPDR
jgi:hypothetical protein